jgi:phage baseplate assembly protein W
MKSLRFPFTVASGRTLQTTSEYEEIVRGQVIDALMTNQAERVFRGEYGCDVQAALFDPSDALVRADAAGYVKDRLQRFVPRCVVTSVTIESPDNEPGVIYISVVYRTSVYRNDQTLRVPVSSEFIQRNVGGGR